MKRIELSEEYKKIYKYIEVVTPELEDYQEYAKKSRLENPATEDQFIDVFTYIATTMIPNRLDLTEAEKDMIMKYHIQKGMKDIMDIIGLL